MDSTLLQAGAAAAGSLALAAAYLDAKFWISKDLNTINRAKQGLKNWEDAGTYPLPHSPVPIPST